MFEIYVGLKPPRKSKFFSCDKYLLHSINENSINLSHFHVINAYYITSLSLLMFFKQPSVKCKRRFYQHKQTSGGIVC